jgi:hypothetical protein
MRSFLTVLLFTASAAMAQDETPLPAWDAEDRAKMVEEGWVAGWLLAEMESIPEEGEVEILPAGFENPTPDELAEAPEDETEVPDGYLDAYFEAKPAGHLVDPQGLLTTEEGKDLETFLGLHSGDSSIDLFVYVFGEHQMIPGDVRDEEMAERLFSAGKPAALIHFHVGAPQRSAMQLSPSVTNSVSVAEQRRSLESSVMRASGKDVPSDQLEAFLQQMSIRIYWMERMTKGTAVETMGSIPEGELSSTKREPVAEEKAELPPWMKQAGVMVAAGFVFLLMLVGAVMWWRARARFRFPEFEVEPRLGGSHAAGIGAVISFGSPAVPPAMQRKQVPDYMRRA